jgi:pimeloyl-ACP methyl ester carboxylesterase
MRGLAACAALFGLVAGTSASARCALHRFPADAGTLAYRSCGRGPIVAILPGGPGLDASYMADMAEAVATNGRRAILLEPRGTGESRAAIGDGSRLTVAGSVADVEALRRALGTDRMVVIGHSFGGAVAQAYAATHPEHVQGLILMDSVGPDMRPDQKPLDGWRKRLEPQELTAYDAARARGDRLAAMKLKFLGSFHRRDRGVAFLKALPDRTIHADIAPLSEDYARHYDVSATARATFPVIIMAGEEDWIRGYEPGLGRTYPTAMTILVPEAGHFPWADAPAATRRALRVALGRPR